MARRGLGYIVDSVDRRDRLFHSLRLPMMTPPREVDLRSQICEMLDQGSLGSCVSNAGFGAIQLKHCLDGIEAPLLGNRLHGYWGARAYDKNTDWDAGSQIRNFFRFINAAGFMPEVETEDGYDILTFKEKPSREERRRMFDQKNKMQGQVSYYRITGEEQVRKAQVRLALANNDPIVFGTSINEDFMSHSGTGIISDFAAPYVGGHAMYLAGYNPAGVWLVNSWGKSWGDAGTALMSWDYLLWQYTSDLWVVDKAPYYSDLAA